MNSGRNRSFRPRAGGQHGSRSPPRSARSNL